MPHVDDLDLLAVASQLRSPKDTIARHVAECPRCQERQAQLLPLVADLPRPRDAAGNFDAIRSRLRTQHPSPRRARWVVPAAVGLLLLMVWPKLWWPSLPTPWGPTGLWVAAIGRYTPLHRDQASSGELAVRWGPQGWAVLTAQNLPALPPHKVYEVWWVLSRQHVRAAVLPQGSSGALALWMYSPRDFQSVTGIGITMEPAPGGARPTGPRQYFASLSPQALP